MNLGQWTKEGYRRFIKARSRPDNFPLPRHQLLKLPRLHYRCDVAGVPYVSNVAATQPLSHKTVTA